MIIAYLTQDSGYGDVLKTYLKQHRQEWTFNHFQSVDGIISFGSPNVLVLDWDHLEGQVRKEILERIGSGTLKPKVIVMFDRKDKKNKTSFFEGYRYPIIYRIPNGRADLLEALKNL